MPGPLRMNALPPELTVNELTAALPPGVAAIDIHSQQGRGLAQQIRNGIAHLVLNEFLASIRRGYRGRSKSDILDHYDHSYAGDARRIADGFNAPERRVSYRLGNHFVAEVEGKYILQFVTRRLGDILASLSPENLCEVGAGNGRNLLYLAERFASVPCTGFELTEAGVATAKKLQKMADLPATGYGQLYRLGAGGMENVRKTKFVCASAIDLPAADRSFDIVYTFAALEQMEIEINQVLSELRRVARRYVLLYEPFADCNDWLGRSYLWARNYFRLSFDDLPKHGFEIVRTWSVVPVKPTFAYAFALLKPR